MTTIARFSLPARDFPLGEVFETRPEARFELDRVVPSGDTVMPYFWVFDDAIPDVREAFDTVPELRSVHLIENLGDKGLFRAEWHPDFLGIMAAIVESGVTVISAVGSTDGWVFDLRSSAEGQIGMFRQLCADYDIPITLTRLSQLTDRPTETAFNLTPDQREALVLAYRLGYYDEPRQTDLDTLAAEIGISRQAFAARLRRGYRNFIESAIAEDSA